LQNTRAPADAANRPNATASPSPRRWGRTDRHRLLVFVAIGFLLPGVGVLALMHALGGDSSVFTIRRELPTKAIMAFFIVLATWIVSRMENRPLDDYGLPPRQAFGKRFWEGALWGFAMLSLILLILYLSGHFRIDSVSLTGRALYFYALAWAVTFLAVSVSEELGFRGYWLFTLSRRITFWRAAVFLSCIFGAAHIPNHGENALGILQVIATGLFFCLTIRRTSTLWFALGFHAAWDWAETFFYGTPDSGLLGVGRYLNTSVQGPGWLTGGSAGPEGSIVALLVLLLCALLIHLRFPHAIYPDRPA
jgi:CAAX protease family protein